MKEKTEGIETDDLYLIQKHIDSIVANGATHATTIVTYPGGQQIVIEAFSSNAIRFDMMRGFHSQS